MSRPHSPDLGRDAARPTSRVRSKSPAEAPGPGIAVTERASSGSPQCEHDGRAVTTCPQAVCLISTGGPPVWRVDIRDQPGRLIAHGEVRPQNVAGQ